MNYTENYQLCQWEASDPIRREDFNRDNAAIDAALGALAAGQLRTAAGTYTGTGTYGSGNANTLTFPFAPKVVVIVANVRGDNIGGTVLLAGQSGSSGLGSVSTSSAALSLALTWSGNSVSWYTTSSYASANVQLNNSNMEYHYFAIG